MATILVVDDDPQIRVLFHSILGESLGHELLFAPGGYAGIEGFKRFRPDLVITDLVMPDLDGVPMIERLKAAYPESKIIAISGKAPELLEKAKALALVAAFEGWSSLGFSAHSPRNPRLFE